MIKRILGTCLSVVLAVCACVWVRTEAPSLRFHGQILMPDGTPATKAELTFAEIRRPASRVQTNGAATFQFSAPCLGRAKLLARLPDGSLQCCVNISPVEARSLQSSPIRITLRPAQQVQVNVTANQQPLGGVRISTDEDLLVSATTNQQGIAELLVPEGAGEFILTAWHPRSGTSGMTEKVEKVSSRPMTVKMALSPIAPQRVQVIDEKCRPVPNLPCTANGPFSFQGWFRGSSFKELIRTTNSHGLVEFDYVYPGADFVDIELQDHQWALEKSPARINAARTIPTIQVRQRQPAKGKLVAPAGTQLEGLFVVARSQGSSSSGDTATARADKHGNFTIGLAPAQCYLITVDDPQWTTYPLIGVFASGGAPLLPEALRLSVKPAIPFTIVATAGPKNEPVADALIMVGRTVEWRWFDPQGGEHNGSTWLNKSLATDHQGRLSVGLAEGTNTILIVKGEWSESKDLDVKSDSAGKLEFHAPDIGP